MKTCTIKVSYLEKDGYGRPHRYIARGKYERNTLNGPQDSYILISGGIDPRQDGSVGITMDDILSLNHFPLGSNEKLLAVAERVLLTKSEESLTLALIPQSLDAHGRLLWTGE